MLIDAKYHPERGQYLLDSAYGQFQQSMRLRKHAMKADKKNQHTTQMAIKAATDNINRLQIQINDHQ